MKTTTSTAIKGGILAGLLGAGLSQILLHRFNPEPLLSDRLLFLAAGVAGGLIAIAILLFATAKRDQDITNNT